MRFTFKRLLSGFKETDCSSLLRPWYCQLEPESYQHPERHISLHARDTSQYHREKDSHSVRDEQRGWHRRWLKRSPIAGTERRPETQSRLTCLSAEAEKAPPWSGLERASLRRTKSIEKQPKNAKTNGGDYCPVTAWAASQNLSPSSQALGEGVRSDPLIPKIPRPAPQSTGTGEQGSRSANTASAVERKRPSSKVSEIPTTLVKAHSAKNERTASAKRGRGRERERGEKVGGRVKEGAGEVQGTTRA